MGSRVSINDAVEAYSTMAQVSQVEAFAHTAMAAIVTWRSRACPNVRFGSKADMG